LTGFAHGAAGIIYALAQLFELTGDGRFRSAAAEALTYENSLFSEAEGNWPHLLSPRKDGGFDCWNSWCNGAPGIGLGRLGSIVCLGLDCVISDVNRCLVAAAKSGSLGHIDFPCCGTLGRAEFFLEAGRRLGAESLNRQARVLAEAVVGRAARAGKFGLGRGNSQMTFHQGLAGVGYQLLRVARPQLVPSVLSWE
jgi:lantibiotic modifying enzyme